MCKIKLVGNGYQTIGVTAEEVAFDAVFTETMVIRAHKDNTGTIFVGDENILSDGSNHFTTLDATEEMVIDYTSYVNPIYLISDTAGQVVSQGAIVKDKVRS